MKVFTPLLKEMREKKLAMDTGSCEMESLIKKISNELLDIKYKPSESLKKFLDKQLRRSKYPMEVAIVGQFSSGKSTFLNALLGKDVLPTGITPVTSKVNFINYAQEYKIEVTYNSGAKEFYAIEHLAKFTDQREALDDIRYLSLFAPVEMLKDISFVDTPGLNSQSNFDTKTTTKILRSVDGIIWLGLIDAVAKKTELDVLEEYLDNYANKSICLLNQKDKISEEEVGIALAYAKTNYKNYFSKIIAISAKEALQARINKQNLQDSNMQDVLDFINNEIRPKAKDAKLFSLKQTIRSAITLLQDEYTSLTSLYTDLVERIEEYSNEISKMNTQIEKQLSSALALLNADIQELIEYNVASIYANITRVDKNFAEQKRSLLGTKYTKHEYKSFELSALSFDKLKVKNIQEDLHNIQEFSMRALTQKRENFEKELILWRVKVLQTQKKRSIGSDEELYEIKYFAAGIFEELHQDYQAKLQNFKNTLEHKISKLSFYYRFELAYEKTLSQIHTEIIQMQNAYEKDTLHSVINGFDESEILLKFKENLEFEYIKSQLRVDDSFVNSALNAYAKEVNLSKNESIEKIQQRFSVLNNKVKDLENIKL